MEDARHPYRGADAVDRRTVLRRWLPAAAAGVGFAAASAALAGRPGRHRPAEAGDEALPAPPDWRLDPEEPGRIATASGGGPAANVRRALAALGGIQAFVAPGETVVVKPNCAWDRRPEQAANTDPDLVAELVRLCLAAGASRVVVADNTCHDPARAFRSSGIGPASEEAGATVAHQGSGGTVAMDLGGIVLGRWEVLAALASADRVINVPIVKHHSLSRATLGMKNWFGAIVGGRSQLHQRIAESCAELGAAFRPTLTVVDATRVLTGGGPTGGSLALVRTLDRVAVATDPVAADAWGGEQLDLRPGELHHLPIAERLGLGTADWRSLEVTG